MKRLLKIIAIVVLAIIVGIAAFLGYAYYKIKNIKDTHDLQDRVTTACNKYIQEQHAPGVCVGIMQGDKVWIQGFGTIDKDRAVVPTASTIFEIGSISKVFTTEMAQLLVDSNQLSWTDNINKYLPAGIKRPDDNTTLTNLATHTSGFPGLPEAWFPKIEANECDPYSKLDTNDLYLYLKNSKGKKKPDMKNYEYSNLGMGLLGHILEWKTGKRYETLLQEMICAPLGMTNTTTGAVNDSLFATPYDEEGKKTCHWRLPILPGAGAIRSDITDMLKFLKANMDSDNPLSKSFARTHKEQAAIAGGAIAYGWHIDKLNGIFLGVPEITWHNGGTGGFRTYLGFVPGSHTGIVIWANKADEKLDELAIQILVKAKIISLK